MFYFFVSQFNMIIWFVIILIYLMNKTVNLYPNGARCVLVSAAPATPLRSFSYFYVHENRDKHVAVGTFCVISSGWDNILFGNHVPHRQRWFPFGAHSRTDNPVFFGRTVNFFEFSIFVLLCHYVKKICHLQHLL